MNSRKGQMQVKILCLDCHEENDMQVERCRRCGRLLEDARKDRVHAFEEQHQDAPGIVKKPGTHRTTW